MTPNAKKTYDRLSSKRDIYLERARDCARLTIPSLFPEEGHDGHNSLPNPNQSFGSRAVNVLSSKLLMGLFPANVPIFKHQMSKAAQLELSQDEEAYTEIQRLLSMIEGEAASEMEGLGWRPKLGPTLSNLIVGGNYLVYVRDDNTLEGFNLANYVVDRDNAGNLIELVVHQMVHIDTLPEDTRNEVKTKVDPTGKQEVHLYTHVYRKGKMFNVYQECSGVLVEGSEGSYPESKLPWLPLRWTVVDGEDYGRSHVEDYFGDLNALDVITKAVRESAAIGAKTIILNRPNGMTKARDIAKAQNGDIISGNPDDTVALQMGKSVDLQVAKTLIDDLKRDLGHAFLMNSAVQRNGERVTLGEVRFMINELNDALGGIFAVLSQELQHSLVVILLDRMQKAKKLPRLPQQGLKISIVTGLDALSREHELEKLQQGLGMIAQLLGPEAVAQNINIPDIITRVFSNLRIDPDGAVKSPQQIQQEQQQQMMMQAAQSVTPEQIQQAQQITQQAGATNNQ